MAKVRLYWRGSKAHLDWAEGGERFRWSIGQPDAREAERIRAAKEAELTQGGRISARLPKVRDYLEWYLDWYEARLLDDKAAKETVGKGSRSEHRGSWR